MSRYIKGLLSVALLFAGGGASAVTISADRVGVCSWSWRLPMEKVAAKMDAVGGKAFLAELENPGYTGNYIWVK